MDNTQDKRYGIIIHPGHNRVYYETAKRLAAAEFGVATAHLSVRVTEYGTQEIANVPYFTFRTDAPLTEQDLGIIARLSFVFCMFEIAGETFKPVTIQTEGIFPSDINTVLKYSGKTNELFTKLLINVARLSSNFGGTQLSESSTRYSLLDPVAGKGTTLFEGLCAGLDVAGIESDERSVGEAVTFFTRYLETHRYKHETHAERVGITDPKDKKPKKSLVTSFRIARDKADQKTGNIYSLTFVQGDCTNADKYFKKSSFHHIVGDLPYGIQWKASSRERTGSLNPVQLLEHSLPLWVRLLKTGGTICLSWNTFVLPRAKIAELFVQHGLEVMESEPYTQFAHRVDQAINRDIIVGRLNAK